MAQSGGDVLRHDGPAEDDGDGRPVQVSEREPRRRRVRYTR